MYVGYTDEVLTDLLKKDDARALESLFERYYAPLCQFCTVYTKDYNVAEEIIADLFIKLWDNRQSTDIQKIKNYLFVSARNLSLNHKQKKKQPVDSFEDINLQQHLLQDTDTPFKILANRESDQQILAIVNTLPARQREVLLMSRIDNIDKHTIADVLAISVRTVETTLYQATIQLRQLLKEARKFSSDS